MSQRQCAHAMHVPQGAFNRCEGNGDTRWARAYSAITACNLPLECFFPQHAIAAAALRITAPQPPDPPDPESGFGPRLKRARLKRSLTQMRAAEILGIHHADFARMESPPHNDPDRPTRSPLWNKAYRTIITLDLPLECFFPHEPILAAARRLIGPHARHI